MKSFLNLSKRINPRYASTLSRNTKKNFKNRRNNKLPLTPLNNSDTLPKNQKKNWVSLWLPDFPINPAIIKKAVNDMFTHN